MPLSLPRKKHSAQLTQINDLINKKQEVISSPDTSWVEENLANCGQEEDAGPCIDESDLWIVKYDELAQKTKNIPLSHLGCCKEGGELFSDLCMWVDINQKYVDLGLFPQWDDIARELNIDQMKTEWVRVCVRPEQSFTRAILEIYMNDGGSLGDVITALRKQKQYRIIQEISDKAEEFMDVYNTYHKNTYNAAEAGGLDSSTTNVHLYSILRTLFESFNKAKQEDPLNKFQLYSGGFKQYLKSLSDTHNKNTDSEVIVNMVHFNEPANIENHDDSGYTSPYRYEGILPPMTETNLGSNPLTELPRNGEKKVKGVEIKEEEKCMKEKVGKVRHTLRVLLIFAKDGITHADTIVTGMANFSLEDFPTIHVDFFRLNEVELWNALLLNPEACLMKWIDEMDFVMPILTPEFLQDLHSPSVGPPAPTSAMINKYIYTLLRSDYVSNGCQNKKVRPLIPKEFVEQLCRCKPVLREPLFKMWKDTEIITMKSRVGAMIKIWAKNNLGQ